MNVLYQKQEPVRNEDGLLNGFAAQKLPNGREYAGYWKNGAPHGRGTMRFPGGSFEGDLARLRDLVFCAMTMGCNLKVIFPTVI